MNSPEDFLAPNTKSVADLLGPSNIRKLEKEKRGQGSGKDYKPYSDCS